MMRMLRLVPQCVELCRRGALVYRLAVVLLCEVKNLLDTARWALAAGERMRSPMNSGVPVASILLAVAYLAWFGAPDGAQRSAEGNVEGQSRGGSARSVAEFLPERLSGVSCNGLAAAQSSEGALVSARSGEKKLRMALRVTGFPAI
jgi:hypothetical protein